MTGTGSRLRNAAWVWGPRLATLLWSGWFLNIAQARWRHERICAMVCGPFIPVELVEQYRRAFDWRTPLAIAAVPLVVWILWAIWRKLRPRQRALGAPGDTPRR